MPDICFQPIRARLPWDPALTLNPSVYLDPFTDAWSSGLSIYAWALSGGCIMRRMPNNCFQPPRARLTSGPRLLPDPPACLDNPARRTVFWTDFIYIHLSQQPNVDTMGLARHAKTMPQERAHGHRHENVYKACRLLNCIFEFQQVVK
jgi:hypothetical protein